MTKRKARLGDVWFPRQNQGKRRNGSRSGWNRARQRISKGRQGDPGTVNAFDSFLQPYPYQVRSLCKSASIIWGGERDRAQPRTRVEQTQKLAEATTSYCRTCKRRGPWVYGLSKLAESVLQCSTGRGLQSSAGRKWSHESPQYHACTASRRRGPEARGEDLDIAIRLKTAILESRTAPRVSLPKEKGVQPRAACQGHSPRIRSLRTMSASRLVPQWVRLLR
jgi:hypothetical protein